MERRGYFNVQNDKLLTSFAVTRQQQQQDAVFDVSLTALRLCTTLANVQLDAQIF
jgi:hypothetical protein